MRNRLMWGFMAACVAAGRLAGGGGEEGTSRPASRPDAPGPAEAAPDPRPIVRVETAEGLVTAIGPDRIVELAPGEYDLNTVKRVQGVCTSWKKTDQGDYELQVQKCPNLAVRGRGDKPARIVGGSAAAAVLTFRNCPGLAMANLSVGRRKGRGQYPGGTVSVEEARGVRIERCVLHGPGAEGLRLTKVSDVRLVDSVVEDCQDGAVLARRCQGVKLERSVFRNNLHAGAFVFADCRGVELVDCQVTGNLATTMGTGLFTALGASGDMTVTVRGGTIRGNSSSGPMGPPGVLVVTGAEVAGNYWQSNNDLKATRGQKHRLRNGAWGYCVPIGQVTFEAVSTGFYGSDAQAEALGKANPGVKEPLRPDTMLTLPFDESLAPLPLPATKPHRGGGVGGSD